MLDCIAYSGSNDRATAQQEFDAMFRRRDLAAEDLQPSILFPEVAEFIDDLTREATRRWGDLYTECALLQAAEWNGLGGSHHLRDGRRTEAA